MSKNIYSATKSFLSANRAYFIWIIAASFYLYQYIIRISPGIMIDSIRDTFGVNAQEFATLGSLTLIVYAICQIPVGILMDKIGVKKVLMFSISICAISSAISAYTDTFWIMQFSRFLVGIGSAAGFMSGIKIVVDNFEPGSRALLMGATLSVGTVGAWLFGVFFEDGIYENWRQILKYISILGVLIFAACYFIMSKDNIDTTHKSRDFNLSIIISEIVTILKNPKIMIYAILAIGLYSPLAVITDLWGSIFIKTKFGIEEKASQTALLLYLGLTIGAILLPNFFEKRSSLDWGIIISYFIITAIFSCILYLPPLPYRTLCASLIIIGIFCGSETMCFTAALRSATPQNSGLIIGIVNTMNMAGGAILQQVIGILLDSKWDGQLSKNGIRLYSEQNFTFSLSIITLVFAICCILSLFLSRKN